MTCKLGLIFLPCSISGKGLTSKSLETDGRRLQLMAGHGSRFPDVVDGGHYYIRVEGCNSCCEVMKVVGKETDVLIVERDNGTQCTCIHSNSSVQYSLDNPFAYQDLQHYIPLKVTDPLTWNCETNTLSIDCSKLFDGSCGDLGCDCEQGTPDRESSGPSEDTGAGTGVGLRGGKGEKGDPGVGISNITVTPAGFLSVTLDNGKVIQAGKVPQAKGTPGERGEKGDPGPRGEKGEQGTSIAGVRLENYELIVTLETGASLNLGSVRGEQGIKGDTGEKGERGEKGDLPYVQYVKVGKKAKVFGPANASITIEYMTMEDAAADKKNQVTASAQTNDKGITTIPAIPDGMYMEFYVDGKLVGIGNS